jgi:hypothetical protein
MGPLVRVTYSGLTQIVFILDRVKSSSYDCPAKIPVDLCSNVSCFTCFSSGSSSPKVAEFCPTLHLVYFKAWAYASTCALSSFHSLPCDIFVQKVVPQMEKLSLSVIAFKDLSVSRVLFRKNSPIVIPQVAHQAPDTCFHMESLRFTPPLCNYYHSPLTWDSQFSSTFQVGETTRKGVLDLFLER